MNCNTLINPYTLSNDEINSLFVFCANHYVHTYDLQVELVDHLAEAIETKMNANTATSFNEALLDVYSSFGYNGFATIVKNKTREVEKWTNRTKWQIFLSYFTWPKALIVIAYALAIYTLGNLIPLQNINIGVLAVCCVALIAEVALSIVIYKRYKKSAKPLLLLNSNYFAPPIFTIQMLNIYINFLGGGHENFMLTLSGYYILSASFILLILIKLAGCNFSKQVYAIAKERYPAAFTQ